MKVLVDTNIIIDALQNRTPFAKEAQIIFEYRACERFEGYTTAKAATDIFYLMHRQTHDPAATRAMLIKLFKYFYPLDSLAADCINAIASPISDFEDAMMIETAKRCKVDYIVTRDKDYANSDMPILSPQAFIELLQAEQNE